MADADALFDTHMVLSLALDYPGEDWHERAEAIASVRLPDQIGAHVDAFLDVAQEGGVTRLREHYVETFDNRRRCSLYLTYYDMGDTRRRGAALQTMAEVYRALGYRPSDEELPDYLPQFLELSARSRDVLVSEVLAALAPGLQVVKLALERLSSPYAHLLAALDASLPELTEDQRTRVITLVSQGPPSELVGLDDHPVPLTLGDTQ